MKFEKSGKFNQHSAEVNLVPFIDLLSVCICFLLLTAVWMQSTVLATKQGLGTESEVKEQEIKSLWVELDGPDRVIVSTKGFSKDLKKRVSLKTLADYAQSLRQQNEDLRTALVLPDVDSSYEQLVHAMNELRKAKFVDIGISPL